jgi:hypothetical protein
MIKSKLGKEKITQEKPFIRPNIAIPGGLTVGVSPASAS